MSANHHYNQDIESKYFPEYENGLPSTEGKNVVITGTTSGTGLVAALTCLKKGGNCAFLNRNEGKARKALTDYFAKSPEAETRAHFVNCDLQDFSTVRQAAKDVAALFPEGVDVIANNAGVMALEDKSTKDGYDIQMQTNHLSHFLLTKELYPLLKKAAEGKGEARVVNHSSLARFGMSGLSAKYMAKDLGGKLGGNGNSMLFNGGRWERYHQTKLANSVFTCELQKRLTQANSKVISLCAHPGLAATNLQATTAQEGGLESTSFMSQAQSQEDGAMGLVMAMFDKNVKKGAMYGPLLFSGAAKERYHGWLSSSSAGRTLWTASEKACGEFKL